MAASLIIARTFYQYNIGCSSTGKPSRDPQTIMSSIFALSIRRHSARRKQGRGTIFLCQLGTRNMWQHDVDGSL
jgi:hypothetical protein